MVLDTEARFKWSAEGKGNIRWCRTLRHDTSARLVLFPILLLSITPHTCSRTVFLVPITQFNS